MDFALVLYIFFCTAIALMGLETLDYKRWRWSIAGMLMITLVASVMLALGRIWLQSESVVRRPSPWRLDLVGG